MKTRSMSASLESCSEELLGRIANFIKSPSELALLGRASKRFYRITSPYLYAHVSFDGGQPDIGIGKLRPFTLLMLRRPDLASLVQSFTIRRTYATTFLNHWLEDNACWNKWPQHPDIESLVKAAITKHGLTEEMSIKWQDIVRRGCNEGAILALLLPIFINLRFIDVPFSEERNGDGEGIKTTYTLQMLERARGGQEVIDGRMVFGKLTDIMIPGVDDKHPDDPKWFATSVGLPAVKRIYGFNQGNGEVSPFDTEDDTEIFSKLQSRSSSVEYIELRHSKLNDANIRYLLRMPKCLKTMIYEIGNTWAWTRINFSVIQSALELQKDSLERLYLGHNPSYFPFFHNTGDQLTPMSFSKFASLKELRVAPIYLYGWEGVQMDRPPSQEDLKSTRMVVVDALPSRIESLGFFCCEHPSTLDRLVLSLQEVLTCKQKRFKHLRRVTVHGTNVELPPSQRHLRTLSPMEQMTVLRALPWNDKGVGLVVTGQEKFSYGKEGHKNRAWGWDEEVEWGECANDRCMPVEVLYDSEVGHAE